MSDKKDNFDTQAETVASNSSAQQKKPITIAKENVVDVAKKRSLGDYLLWLLAIGALIASTLVSEYLPRYWAKGGDIWIQVGITAVLVVFAIICLVFTNQGRAFKVLLKDAGIELRRVTWPSKDETIKYSWQVLVVMVIAGTLVWLLDNLFNSLIAFILN